MTDRRRQIRVLTVDDHAVTRQGLGLLLSHVEDIQLVAAAADGRRAVQLAREHHPEVVLMDAIMPGLNGLEATRQVKRALPDIRVVILSGYVDEDQLVSALRAGVDGYIEKTTGIEEVLRAVRTVSRGGKYFSRRLEELFDMEDLLQRAQDGGGVGNVLEQLSTREREVLQLVGEANSNQRIADELSISIKTVEAHLTRIRDKLGAKSRGDLIRIALRAGLVRDEQGVRAGAADPGEASLL